MTLPNGYKAIEGTEHTHATHKDLGATAANEPVTVTLVLRRREGGPTPRAVAEFAPGKGHKPLSRAQYAAAHAADPADVAEVTAFAKAHGLDVVESDASRRAVVVRGSVAAVNKALAVELHDYDSARGKYRGHAGAVGLPKAVADRVEAVVGLDDRRVPAQHYSTAAHHGGKDPQNTKPLTPQEVATLYEFPAGDGAGQTIGIYEMETQSGRAGYTAGDIAETMKAFGGGLKAPKPIDVAVDGVGNAGVSDGETVLDVTVASAIAQGAKIAVYFTGGTTQSIVHSLQRMIHPGAGDPTPTVISISYGWGPDDASAGSFSEATYKAIGALFQDAATLGITVLVSSGDSGAFIADSTQAQASYPASEPWVIACGGTTIGNVKGAAFDEYAWNDVGAAGRGATGGGVSARFEVPSYQSGVAVPARVHTGTRGRGMPDLAGNASENSGYPAFLDGKSAGPIGGTSAVAPLYAGLFARINANLGSPVGFVNPILYSLAATAFRDVVGPAGPANNSFGDVTGYPVAKGWDACTGLGSVKGEALERGLKAALASSKTS
jgi:kumamolisin